MRLLRIITIVATVCTVAVSGYFMTIYTSLPTPTFNKAILEATGQGSEEQAKKIKIISAAVIDSDHPFTPQEFYATDTEGTTFRVNYTGNDPLPTFKNGEAIDIIGHVHGGEMPYVHASQVIKSY